MATITSTKIIKVLLENKGHYGDDPAVATIWSYTSFFNILEKCFAIYYHAGLNPHDTISPVLLQKDGKNTPAGKKLLESL
ncbi:MAG: hypothetical protein QQN63_06435 [Nitrosopumilus sp.]